MRKYPFKCNYIVSIKKISSKLMVNLNVSLYCTLVLLKRCSLIIVPAMSSYFRKALKRYTVLVYCILFCFQPYWVLPSLVTYHPLCYESTRARTSITRRCRVLKTLSTFTTFLNTWPVDCRNPSHMLGPILTVSIWTR